MARFVTLANISMRLEDLLGFQDKRCANYNPFHIETERPAENNFNHEEIYADEPAIFSTRGGHYPKRPSPSILNLKQFVGLPPFERLPYAVKVVAARLCNDFPLDRKAVLDLSWQRLQYYFDDMDIHYWGVVFLQQVLLCIYDDNRKQHTEMLHFAVHLMATDPIRLKNLAYFGRAEWLHPEVVCYGSTFLQEMTKFMTHRPDMIKQLTELAQKYIAESRGESVYPSMWCTEHFKQLRDGHVAYPGNAAMTQVYRHVVPVPPGPTFARSVSKPIVLDAAADSELDGNAVSKSTSPDINVQSETAKCQDQEAENIKKLLTDATPYRAADYVEPPRVQRKVNTPVPVAINTGCVKDSAGPTTAPMHQAGNFSMDRFESRGERSNSVSQFQPAKGVSCQSTEVTALTIPKPRQKKKVSTTIINPSQASCNIQIANEDNVALRSIQVGNAGTSIPLQRSEITSVDCTIADDEHTTATAQTKSKNHRNDQHTSRSREPSRNSHVSDTSCNQDSLKTDIGNGNRKRDDSIDKRNLSSTWRKGNDKKGTRPPSHGNQRCGSSQESDNKSKKKYNNTRNKLAQNVDAQNSKTETDPGEIMSSRPSSSMSILQDDASIISVVVNGQRHYSPPRSPGLSEAPHLLQPNHIATNGSCTDSGERKQSGRGKKYHITWPSKGSGFDRVTSLPGPIWNAPSAIVAGPPPPLSMQLGPEIMTPHGPLIPVTGPPPRHLQGPSGPAGSQSPIPFIDHPYQRFNPEIGSSYPHGHDVSSKNSQHFHRNKGSRKRYPNELQQGHGKASFRRASHFDHGHHPDTYQRRSSSNYGQSSSFASVGLPGQVGSNWRPTSNLPFHRQYPQAADSHDTGSHGYNQTLSPAIRPASVESVFTIERTVVPPCHDLGNNDEATTTNVVQSPYNYPMVYDQRPPPPTISHAPGKNIGSFGGSTGTEPEIVAPVASTTREVAEIKTKPISVESPVGQDTALLGKTNPPDAHIEPDREAAPKVSEPVVSPERIESIKDEPVSKPQITSGIPVDFDAIEPVVKLPDKIIMNVAREPSQSMPRPLTWAQKAKTSATNLTALSGDIKHTSPASDISKSVVTQAAQLTVKSKEGVPIGTSSSTTSSTASSIKKAASPKRGNMQGDFVEDLKLYVAGVGLTSEILENIFEEFRPIAINPPRDCKLSADPSKPSHPDGMKFTFVTFDSEEACGKARVALAGEVKEGIHLKVNVAFERDGRSSIQIASIPLRWRTGSGARGQTTQNATKSLSAIKNPIQDTAAFWQHVNRDKQMVRPAEPAMQLSARSASFLTIAEASEQGDIGKLTITRLDDKSQGKPVKSVTDLTSKKEVSPITTHVSEQEHIRKEANIKSEGKSLGKPLQISRVNDKGSMKNHRDSSQALSSIGCVAPAEERPSLKNSNAVEFPSLTPRAVDGKSSTIVASKIGAEAKAVVDSTAKMDQNEIETTKESINKAKVSASTACHTEHPPVQTRAKKVKYKSRKNTNTSNAASFSNNARSSRGSTENLSGTSSEERKSFSQLTTAVQSPELMATPAQRIQESSTTRDRSPSKIGRAIRSLSNLFRNKSPEKSADKPTARHQPSVEDPDEVSSVELSNDKDKTTSGEQRNFATNNHQNRKKRKNKNGGDKNKESIDDGGTNQASAHGGNVPEGKAKKTTPTQERVTKLLKDAPKNIEKSQAQGIGGNTRHGRSASYHDLTDGGEDAAQNINNYHKIDSAEQSSEDRSDSSASQFKASEDEADIQATNSQMNADTAANGIARNSKNRKNKNNKHKNSRVGSGRATPASEHEGTSLQKVDQIDAVA